MSATYASFMEKLDKILHQKSIITPYLEKAEQLTGVKRVHLALGFGVIWALYMILGKGAELICNAIGFGYPAYASMIALESDTKIDDTKWLTYWVTFAAFSLLEFFSEIILDFVPFYWLMKCIFLIWCFAPISNNGSQFLYHRVIRPVFLKNRKSIDDVLNKATTSAAGLAKDAAGKLISGKSE
ncbi:receptor expression-enhancing protein 5-like [Uloborus diversus]|uniref:receptor expression-enhancing protein 5-like n=1 Tax=Uloborus diversus TaxID=327109 RepID=UPI00240A4E9F|nr:receptor expression-enhancing protein 5-like [Uloborus diversus]